MRNLYAALGVDSDTPSVLRGVGELTDLGVRKGGVLLVHSSLKSVRLRAGGIENVVAALAGSIGDGGTLLIPSLSFDVVTKEQPVFNREQTPSCIGAIPEYFRTLPVTARSVHPTHSVCGYGADMEAILGSHHLDATPVGANSPFRAVRDRKGQILMLGCGLVPMTSMHGVEEVAEAPYVFGYDITYTIQDGARQYTAVHKHHGFRNLNQRYDRIADVLAPPAIRRGSVFGAECWLVEASALWEICAEKMRHETHYFVEKA